MNFLEPWYPVSDSKAIENQLKAELSKNHALCGTKVKALAQRQDCDDFLFCLDDGSMRVAVVHLSFSRNTDARYPRTELYSDIETWIAERMNRDHVEFNT